ncbi:AC3 protein [Ramie yellow mosaic virus]|uniref:Replication enhancer n=1 Tax=Ramie mosaic Yunnan virus TaxID=1874886 RepID=A0A1B1QKW9_9GEMI|nr:AC3 protein [Ramie mosaic Yunnan virus]ANT82191.1 AC3 protein [Ramie yellow mosaic virus]ANT82185.1 AC3 protein [Ramie mosaic Yunnan virus]ANT82197.1 AC3 protein [Ramie yellow mosaic virus]AVU88418.1 replication enhancer protein [Ramie yellow mosaic virus]AVU88424.1 replication enhancer protein [Ramie yellow mosaic virus]
MDSRTGEYITAIQAENGVYIWQVPNPLYFKITKHDVRPFLNNFDIITLQVQFNYNLRKALGIHQCFLICRIWTRLQPQTGRFLRVFKYQCMKYLDNVGIISLNNVIRAISNVMYDVFEGTIDVQLTHIIKYNIY